MEKSSSARFCIYEFKTKVLFSGDTVFAGGTLSYIAESGSLGDYINSIVRLEARRISEIYPGHGKMSKTPEQDFSQAIMTAKKLLAGDRNLSVSPFRPSLEAEEPTNSGRALQRGQYNENKQTEKKDCECTRESID